MAERRVANRDRANRGTAVDCHRTDVCPRCAGRGVGVGRGSRRQPEHAGTCPRDCGELMPKRLIDVSHTIEHGMITYKGFPAPIICDWLSREASRTKYAAGTEVPSRKIEMIANTGTYIDSPFHRYENGKDLSELPLESLADLDCLVIRVDPATGPAIEEIPIAASQVAGRAVLFCTGWDRHWQTDKYFEGHPYLTERAAEWLVKAGAALVGIDSLNIDSVATGERPVHSVLLGSEIPIVEHMRGLSALPATGSRFFAVPVKVKAFGTFPVRAFALV